MNTPAEHDKTLTELCESMVAVCRQIQESDNDADRVMKSATVVWLAEQIDQKARDVVRRNETKAIMGRFDRVMDDMKPARLSFMDACNIVYP